MTLRSEPTSEVRPAGDADTATLVAWLADRDVACPLCQYNLRGLTSPRCPECGQVLRLSVALAEPYLKAWIALIAGLLPVAGFGSLIVCGMVYSLLRWGTRGLHFGFIPFWEAFALLHTIGSVPLSVAAIAFRRRFLCWNRVTQKACAAAAWLAVILTLTAVFNGGF